MWISFTQGKLQAPVDGKWKARSRNTYFTWGDKGVALQGWNYPLLGENILLPFLEQVHNLLKGKSSTWFMFKCNCILISSFIGRSLHLDFLTSMLVLSRIQWPRSMLVLCHCWFLELVQKDVMVVVVVVVIKPNLDRMTGLSNIHLPKLARHATYEQWHGPENTRHTWQSLWVQKVV